MTTTAQTDDVLSSGEKIQAVTRVASLLTNRPMIAMALYIAIGAAATLYIS
jgi:hypothetical protein